MATYTKEGPRLIWQGMDLPRVTAGDYRAICVGYQGPEWVRSFRRWSMRLEFSLLSGEGTVSAFFNMGADPRGPRIGRRSRFYGVWCQANGDAPWKGQEMSPETFTEPGLIYLVRVEDSVKDGKDGLKPEALIYSRVTEILRVETRK